MMNRKRKIEINSIKILLMTLVVLMLLPVCSVRTFAGEEKKVGGYIPVKKKVLHIPQKRVKILGISEEQPISEELPVSYRSDQQEWAKGIRVKDQGDSGLCWAISMTTAAEYSYAKETGGNVLEMSPGQLGQFFFNRVNDPLGNTKGDGNCIPEGESWPLYGGNQLYCMQQLGTWSGIGLESEMPFDLISDNIVDYAWDNTYMPYDDSMAYKDYVTLQECIYDYFEDEDLATIKNRMKEWIYNYGSVSIAMEMKKKYMNLSEKKEDGEETYVQGRSFYHPTGRCNIDHAVTIIGWDDEYPKENFKTSPKNDGAWIVQNSWGKDAHEDGIFYMSYESADVTGNFEVYALDMQSADTYQYNFQYDGTADYDDSTNKGNEDFFTGAGTKAANVYKNEIGVPLKLEAVGFTTFNDGSTDYEISIYTGLDDSNDPTSGKLAETISYSTSTAGYKTAVLDRPVQIGIGERYAIVFSFTDDTAFGVEKEYGDGFFSFHVQTDAGQSYFCEADTDDWIDMNDYSACFRIKGFANETEEMEEPSGETPTEEPGGETPSEEPGGETPSEEPGGQTPSEELGGQTPSEKPGGETPSEEPGGQTPSEEPGGETPSEEPGKQTTPGATEEKETPEAGKEKTTPTDPKEKTASVKPAAKGTILVNAKKTASYIVTSSDIKNPTVAYKKCRNKKLKKITIPKKVRIGKVTYTVTAIAANAFKNHKNLTKVKMGKNIRTIGNKAFYRCKKLRTVIMSKNVTKIGKKAFYGCRKLRKLKFLLKQL